RYPGPGAWCRLPHSWLDRRPAHHAGLCFCLPPPRSAVATARMAPSERSDCTGHRLGMVDSGKQGCPLLDTALGTLEFAIVRPSSARCSAQPFARPALVSMANLAVRSARPVEVAQLVELAPYLGTFDVHGLATDHHALPGGRLRTGVRPDGRALRGAGRLRPAHAAPGRSQLIGLVRGHVLFTDRRHSVVGLVRLAHRGARANSPQHYPSYPGL